MGIAPRTLWGWVPSDGESSFDEEQVDLLLASIELEADYGPHGQPLSEAMDDRADPTNYDGGYRYIAKKRTDWAAKELADAQDTFYGDNPKASRNGHMWFVERIDYTPGNPDQD